MISKVSILLSVAFIASLLIFEHSPTTDDYSAWKFNHGIEFSTEQDIYRATIFRKNQIMIDSHNSRLGSTFKLAINKFAATTAQQFQTMYLNQVKNTTNNIDFLVQQSDPLTADIDWQAAGAIRPIRSQGACQANYAFAAIAAIEAAIYIKKQTPVVLSPQQIVDCSIYNGNKGCQGGKISASFIYAIQKPINLESIYPYSGTFKTCTANSNGFQISSLKNVGAYSCKAIDQALALNPVAVMVDGTNFQFYFSGIFTNCGTKQNLPSVIVASTSTFYRLRNSWGADWGEDGYIRVAKDNGCGVCSSGVYPIV